MARKRAERLVASIEVEMRRNAASPIPASFPVSKYTPPSSPTGSITSSVADDAKLDELRRARREVATLRGEKANMREQLRATEVELSRTRDELEATVQKHEHNASNSGEAVLSRQLERLREERLAEEIAASRKERGAEEQKLDLTREVDTRTATCHLATSP